ncbi:MAG: type I secretion system permease/ATPase, partial [Burkholderiaceae bacterium]|nr:type I secretion system permease/ATPase [Burkholderiaceae bacterium]
MNQLADQFTISGQGDMTLHLEQPAKKWKLPQETLISDDPLARCLAILTKIFDNPFSTQTLTAGLPLEDGRLTPALFGRAAARAGLTSRVIKRELSRIASQILPAVLLLKNGSACVATACDTAGVWTIILPESDGGEMQISSTDLASLYDGSVIFSRPAFRFDSRTQEHKVPTTRHWFWDVFRQSSGLYCEVIVATFLINVFALVTPLFAMNVYDRVVPNNAFETLWVLSSGILIVLVFDLIMKTLRAYFLDIAGKRVDVILSASIFEKIMGLKTAVRPQSVGSLASNLQEFEMFRDFITSATMILLIDLPFTALFLVVIFWLGGALVLVPFTAVPIIILIALVLQRPLQGVIRKSFRVGSQKHATLIEVLAGIDTVKAAGAEGVVQKKWENIISEQSDLSLRSKLLTNAIINQSGFFQQATYIAVIIAGCFLISDRTLTVGGLIACSMLTSRITAPLSQVASLITRYYQARSAVQGVDDIMQLPEERPIGKSYIHRPVLAGDIEFRNVTFSYPEAQVPA